MSDDNNNFYTPYIFENNISFVSVNDGHCILW